MTLQRTDNMTTNTNDASEHKKKTNLPIEQFESFIEISPEPIVVYSHGIIVYINQAGAEIVGAESPLDIIGRNIIEFLHPEYIESTIIEIKQLFKYGIPSELIEKKWIRLDGGSITVEVRAVPTVYSNEPAVMLLCRDITERKKMEESLIASEYRYRRLLQMSPEAIVIHAEGIIIYVNDAAIRLVRAERTEHLTGRSIFEFLHNDYQVEARKRLSQIEKTNDTLDYYVYKCIRMDGEVFEAEATSIEMYDIMGQSVIQTVFRDVTERNKREQFFRQSGKLSAIGQLAAGVAHEIRNPLTTLMGFTKLILQNADQDKEYKKYAPIMMSELKRINNIVNEFMDFSKPQKVFFHKQDINILLQEVMTIIETQTIMNNVEVRLDLDTSLPSILCDVNQLKQVFVNVMKNAIEAMENGGVLTIRTRDQDSQILLLFIDTGIGIPEDKISKIGEPFFTTKEKGTGLGVMVCYKIIQAHNGKMHFESKKGEGTVVKIELPVGFTDNLLLKLE